MFLVSRSTYSSRSLLFEAICVLQHFLYQSYYTTVGCGVDLDSTVSKISAISPKNWVFEVLTNLACPDRSETIRNGFPVKFRIDIDPERLKKHFSERKSMKNRAKSPTSTPEARHPPATYYGSSHWIFWRFLKKNHAKKTFFLNMKQKLKILIDHFYL